MLNKFLFIYSVIGTMFNFVLMFFFAYLACVSEIENFHAIMLIALTATGGISGIVSALFYKEK